MQDFQRSRSDEKEQNPDMSNHNRQNTKNTARTFQSSPSTVVIDLTQIEDTTRPPYCSWNQRKRYNTNIDQLDTKRRREQNIAEQSSSPFSFNNETDVSIVNYFGLGTDRNDTDSDNSDSEDEISHMTKNITFRMLVSEIVLLRCNLECFCGKILSEEDNVERHNFLYDGSKSTEIQLCQMIDRLKKKKLVSKRFASCMHDLRQLGNAASHEISRLYEMHPIKIRTIISTYRRLKKEFRRNGTKKQKR